MFRFVHTRTFQGIGSVLVPLASEYAAAAAAPAPNVGDGLKEQIFFAAPKGKSDQTAIIKRQSTAGGQDRHELVRQSLVTGK